MNTHRPRVLLRSAPLWTLMACTSIGTPSAGSSAPPEPDATMEDVREAADPETQGVETMAPADAQPGGPGASDSPPASARTGAPLDSLADAALTDWHLSASDLALLSRRIGRILDRPPFDQMFWGLMVRDLEDGRVMYQRNATRKFVPASNMKILTTAVALAELGPDYRYETEVYALGSIRDGTLNGSLVLVGAGDPTWSDRFYESWRTPMETLVTQLGRAGIRRVTGDLLIDASAWDSTSVVGTWQYEDLPWGWASTGGAFVVADGDVQLRIRGAARVDRAAQVFMDPALPEERLDVEVLTLATDSVRLYPSYRHERGQIVLRGEIPPGKRNVTRLAMRDPVRISAELLVHVLEENGIRIGGDLGYAWEPETDLGAGCAAGRLRGCPVAERIAAIRSPDMLAISKALLEPSQNWITEQVVRTLGLEREGRASWEDGLEAMEARLTQGFGVRAEDLDLHDGSGLSSYSLVTPRAVVTVLQELRSMGIGTAYLDALAAPGEEESTLERRLGDLKGRVFAKTGTIHHVNSLSGYLVRDNGRELVFSILSNASGLESDEVRPAIDDVVRELARW